MVSTGAAPRRNTHPTAPLNVAYWVQFRRGDYNHGPAYTGTYGFDWVEWARNSANNPHTAYDDLTKVMGKAISNYEFCYDPGQPGIPAQAATATQPAIPAKTGIPPQYAPVTGLYKQRYEDELHKGYTKTYVQGNDYYVPWLSLRPHQTVQIKLEVEFLNTNPVQPTNLFTVVANADYVVTINGKTNAAPMQLVPQDKQVLDVTIECLRPSAAVTLEIQDELKHVVGALNIADNTTVYELPLRVVYMLLGKPMNPKDPVGATPARPLYARPGALAALQQSFANLNMLTYLNTQALNQALITCVWQQPTTPYQFLMDKDQWKADGFLKSGVLQPNGLHEYCERSVNADPAIGPFQGITIFVHQLDVPKEAAGSVAASGALKPLSARTLLIYNTGLQVGKNSTLAHELGHVLGLTHAFPMGDENNTIFLLDQAVQRLQGMVPGQQAAIANATQKAASPPTPAEQAVINQETQNLQNLQRRLNENNSVLSLYINNPFKFTQSSTENIMDYDPGASVSIRLSYWHWQWALLQADVATYYGTKTAAK